MAHVFILKHNILLNRVTTDIIQSLLIGSNKHAGRQLGLDYICGNGCRPGGPNVAHNNPKTVEMIGDDNCLFRAFVYAIPGSESQYYRLYCLIVEHLRSFVGTDKELQVLGSLIQDDTIDDYIDRTQIDQEGAWGGDIEMALISHKLKINVASFNVQTGHYWISPMILGKINQDRCITLVTTSMWYYLKSKHVLMTMFLLFHIVYIQSCSATPHAIHRSSLNTEWRQLMVVESVLNELEHLETIPLPQMMMSTSCNGSEEHTTLCGSFSIIYTVAK